MADVVVNSVYSPHLLINNEGVNGASTCQKCGNYEVLLNKTLEELHSIQTINRLLQKELQACTAVTGTWGFNPDSSEDISDLAAGKKWTLVTKGKHMVTSSKQNKSETPVTDLLTRNRYSSLAAIPTDAENTMPVLSNLKKPSGKIMVHTKKVSYKCPKCPKRTKKHKITIVGDSHSRCLAGNLKHNLSNDFDIDGLVKPGADINTLTSSFTENTKHLTFRDILVFWGGANDVSKNNSGVGLKSIEVHNNTNIVLMSVPYRHDLPDWSCVNNEVATFNNKLIKHMKPYKHVTVARFDLDRNFFTRHGMHMNNLGKERIALEVANTVANIVGKPGKVISLQWKSMQGNSMSEGSTVDNTSLLDGPKIASSISTNATVDEEKRMRPVAGDSALTCPDQKILDELVKYTHGAKQISGLDDSGEQGKRSDAKDTKHNMPTMDPTHSLRDEVGKEEVINIRPHVNTVRKSNRAKNPLSAKQNDFLW
jgi:hypothetical protein